MPKFIVKESLIDKLVGAIFGSIGKKIKSKAINDLSAKDPQFAKKVKDLEKQRKGLESYIKKNKKELQKRYPHAGF